MILAPQEIDPTVSEIDLKLFIKNKSEQYNVVVIVPSEYRSKFWSDVASSIVTAENLEDTVNQLKSKHVGLVVMVNKYDGIDLPDSACRILVLDGLPQARRACEQIEMNILATSSKYLIERQIQRIEQGMGRGIRANDDYCVVFLMGASLTRAMFTRGAKEMFSPATRAQIELSSKITEQLSNGLNELDSAIEVCLQQNMEWRKVAREAVANIVYPVTGTVRPIAVAQRKAFDSAHIREYSQAEKALQQVINQAISDKEQDSVIGWLKWQLAEYVDFTDQVRAQQILKSALSLNKRLTRPIGSLDYEKLDAKNIQQANNIVWKFRPYIGKKTKLLVDLNGVLSDLMFMPDHADDFESSMKEVATFIGFKAQRPELEFKRGPDVLWAVGNMRYFVIECKSGAVNQKISKHDANQLSGSIDWFKQRYDHTCKATPIMVHPYRALESGATGHAEMRILTKEKLELLKNAIQAFCTAAASSLGTLDVTQVQKLLKHHKLTAENLLLTYTDIPMRG
jgi:hypothetical protein